MDFLSSILDQILMLLGVFAVWGVFIGTFLYFWNKKQANKRKK